MTEKRFDLVNENILRSSCKFKDNEKECKLSDKQVVDLLNEQDKMIDNMKFILKQHGVELQDDDDWVDYREKYWFEIKANAKLISILAEQDEKIKEQAKMIRTRNAFLASNGFVEEYQHFVDSCKGEYDG